MHNFKYDDNGDFIDWSCEWDGKGESPFRETQDYEEASLIYRDYCTKFEPGKDTMDIVFGRGMNSEAEDGSIRDFTLMTSTYTRAEVADMHPDLILKINCICASNSITRAMCEMLVLTEEHIEGGYSGHTVGTGYFSNVLGCLSRLWD